MDMRTGEIFRGSEEVQKALKEVFEGKRQGPVVELSRGPRKGCSRCHGRGYTARNADTGFVVLCRCVPNPRPLGDDKRPAKKDRRRP